MSTYRIPFNKATLVGKELGYIQEAINRGHISGDGPYTKRCETLLEEELGVHGFFGPSPARTLALDREHPEAEFLSHDGSLGDSLTRGPLWLDLHLAKAHRRIGKETFRIASRAMILAWWMFAARNTRRIKSLPKIN